MDDIPEPTEEEIEHIMRTVVEVEFAKLEKVRAWRVNFRTGGAMDFSSWENLTAFLQGSFPALLQFCKPGEVTTITAIPKERMKRPIIEN